MNLAEHSIHHFSPTHASRVSNSLHVLGAFKFTEYQCSIVSLLLPQPEQTASGPEATYSKVVDNRSATWNPDPLLSSQQFSTTRQGLVRSRVLIQVLNLSRTPSSKRNQKKVYTSSQRGCLQPLPRVPTTRICDRRHIFRTLKMTSLLAQVRARPMTRCHSAQMRAQ